jgi:hypothetical protein
MQRGVHGCGPGVSVHATALNVVWVGQFSARNGAQKSPLYGTSAAAKPATLGGQQQEPAFCSGTRQPPVPVGTHASAVCEQRAWPAEVNATNGIGGDEAHSWLRQGATNERQARSRRNPHRRQEVSATVGEVGAGARGGEFLQAVVDHADRLRESAPGQEAVWLAATGGGEVQEDAGLQCSMEARDGTG